MGCLNLFGLKHRQRCGHDFELSLAPWLFHQSYKNQNAFLHGHYLQGFNKDIPFNEEAHMVNRNFPKVVDMTMLNSAYSSRCCFQEGHRNSCCFLPSYYYLQAANIDLGFKHLTFKLVGFDP
jgi:hypothetical protein